MFIDENGQISGVPRVETIKRVDLQEIVSQKFLRCQDKSKFLFVDENGSLDKRTISAADLDGKFDWQNLEFSGPVPS